MAESSGSNSTPIWVAVITVVGSLLTAVIVNADKLMPRSEASAVAASPTAPTPTQAGPAASPPVTTTGGIRKETQTIAPPHEAAPPARPGPIAPAPDAGPVDLVGEWRDDDGARYSFEQNGSQYEMTQTAINGTFVLMGRGTISGRDLSHTYEGMTGETGSCSARLNATATKITGNCLMSEGGGWAFVIER